MTLDCSSDSGLSSSLDTSCESSLSCTTASDLTGRTSTGSFGCSIAASVFGPSTCSPTSDWSSSFTSTSGIIDSALSTSLDTAESSVSFASFGSDSLIGRTFDGSSVFSMAPSGDTGTSTIFGFSCSNFSTDVDNCCSSASFETECTAGATGSPLTSATRVGTLGACGSEIESFSNSFLSSTGTLIAGTPSIF
ncbi:hypothetical protein OIU79_023268 [Salix purpurea]|uniref:Uncharacterized protein n=1 Tax=Salix purpurea TaxID=77065 RepID=A0A9Q0W8Q9_SALPP|nr:hypothetical protein OIU79_023268 [Salix purpurea]